jgi:hypothetical protein
MMIRRSAFAVFAVLLFAATLSAQTPTTITPASGPTAGGTEVLLTGDFPSWPSDVYFGGIPAASTVRVDAHTYRVVTPAHLPGSSRITVFDYDLFVDLGVTFEFTGEAPPSFEAILLPILTPPTRGAFGSEFHTDFRATSRDNQGVRIYGLQPRCDLGSPCLPVNYGDEPLDPSYFGGDLRPEDITYVGTPGRFIYVPVNSLSNLALNLRVYDSTRDDQNFGTEMPIVRLRDFEPKRLVLTGVPGDPRFRNTLRIYGASESNVGVRIGNGPTTQVHLQRGSDDSYTPAYAVLTLPPTTEPTFKVTIDAEGIDSPILPIPLPIWAFISVTNNDTQMITTITPQPRSN